MSDYNPIFRSPITISNLLSPALTSQPLNSNLILSDLTGVEVTLIQGEAGDLLSKQFGHVPTKPGDLIDVGDGLLARLTSTEFYLFALAPTADLPTAAALDDAFTQSNCFAHATDLTHGKVVLRLVGPQARELLSKICGLDFHETVYHNSHIAQTSAAKIKTLIARYDEGETPAYILHVDRPLGQYFWEVVWDAGQEFGIIAIPSNG